MFFSPDPGNLLNVIFRGWPRSGEFQINKFAGLSRDWVAGKNSFMCFFGSFLVGGGGGT